MTNEEIKALRKSLDLNQRQFAELLDCNTQTVGTWEKGSREPSKPVKRLLKIIGDLSIMMPDYIEALKRKE